MLGDAEDPGNGEDSSEWVETAEGIMKEITLTKGFKAFVDDADFEMLSGFKWYALKKGHNIYALSWCKGTGATIRMHRLLLNAKKGEIVDHINGNGLDNRRENLRIVSASINTLNSKHYATNTSGYRGVRKTKKWVARFAQRVAGKYVYHHLGTFDTPEEAHEAYQREVFKRCGVYAGRNQLESPVSARPEQ